MAVVQVPVISLWQGVGVVMNADSVSALGLSLVFTPSGTRGIAWSYTLLGTTFTGSASAGNSPSTSLLTGLVGNADLSQVTIRTV